MAQGLPGYNPVQIRQQAAQAANAALPTVQSIQHQYGQGISDVQGFAKALIAQLTAGIGATGAGYSRSIADQTTANQAAQARLAAIGSPYAGGSQAAVGGMGNSQLGHLLANRASAVGYASQLPSVGAARASLMQKGLVDQRTQALTQRAQDYRSAYSQALQQAQSNALARSVAIANIGNQRAQLALQRQSLASSNALHWASLRQNASQFSASQRQQYNEFLIGQQNALASARRSGAGGFTGSEISNMAARGQKAIQGYITSGTPIEVAIQHLETGGILPQIARQIALSEYANMTRPPAPSRAAFPNTPNNPGSAAAAYQKAVAAWRADMNAYKVSYTSWVRMMQSLANQRSTQRANTRLSQGTTRATLNRVR